MKTMHIRTLGVFSLVVLAGSICLASIAAAATGGPTVNLTSTSASTTSATSVPITATFSAPVTGFTASSTLGLSNATISGFSGSGSSYSFNLKPTAAGAFSVSIPADVAHNASSTGNQASNTLHFTYAPTSTSTATTSLALVSVSAVRSTAVADGTYDRGFKWLLTFNVPDNETNFQMRFSDFSNASSSSSIIPAANNIRISSAQSSNAATDTNGIVSANNDYGTVMTLNSDNATSTAGRQVQVLVEVKVPFGTTPGSNYTATFGARSAVPTQ